MVLMGLHSTCIWHWPGGTVEEDHVYSLRACLGFSNGVLCMAGSALRGFDTFLVFSLLHVPPPITPPVSHAVC